MKYCNGQLTVLKFLQKGQKRIDAPAATWSEYKSHDELKFLTAAAAL